MASVKIGNKFYSLDETSPKADAKPFPLKDLDLAAYTDDELRALNSRLVGILKLKERSKVYSFRYGDKVEWCGRYGRQTGSVVKVNRQTVMVCAERTGTMWKVSGSLLKKV